MKKLTVLVAGAAGYVLGARAGRQRYEQIASGARSVMGNPKVQAAKQQAQDTVVEQARDRSCGGEGQGDRFQPGLDRRRQGPRQRGDATAPDESACLRAAARFLTAHT